MKILETDRLILREWKLSDKYDLYEYAKNDLVGPNAGWKPHTDLNESEKIIKSFIKNKEVYAIELKGEHKVIGSIGFHRKLPDPKLSFLKQREIGYVLNPNYWGNEYIPEAVSAVVFLCSEELNLDLVWCGHYDYNRNSKRVNEKCGFIYQFSKDEILENLDSKKVTTLYYSIKLNN